MKWQAVWLSSMHAETQRHAYANPHAQKVAGMLADLLDHWYIHTCRRAGRHTHTHILSKRPTCTNHIEIVLLVTDIERRMQAKKTHSDTYKINPNISDCSMFGLKSSGIFAMCNSVKKLTLNNKDIRTHERHGL